MKLRHSLCCLVAPVLASCAGTRPVAPPRSSPAQAEAIFAQFKRLHPPASTSSVKRRLGDASWLSRAGISRLTYLAGWIPLRPELGDAVFNISLTTPHGAEWGYQIWLRLTGDIATEADLRGFLTGAGPAKARLKEFALCYPDGDYRTFPALSGDRPMGPSRISYFDRNRDGRADRLFVHFPGLADADWELRDDNYDGRFEAKIRYGVGIFDSRVDIPVPTGVNLQGPSRRER